MTVSAVSAKLVDMSQDIYNLRRPAHAIMERAHTIRTQDVQAPLIILMGEDHDCPVTRMMQLAVLHKCVEAGLKPAYGIECSYNVPKTLKYREDFDSDSQVQNIFNDAAALPHCLTNEFFTATSTVWMEHIAQYCMQQGIPVSYNDAARNPLADVCTDAQDPLTIEIAQKLGVKEDDKRYFCSTTREGIFLRNVIIAQNAMDQLERHKPDVLVHMLGASHVMGELHGEGGAQFPYSQSLHPIFKLAGYPVISFLPFDPAARIPSDAPLDDCVAVTGWENARCRFYSDKDVADHQRFIASRSDLPRYKPLEHICRMNALERFMKQVRDMANAKHP